METRVLHQLEGESVLDSHLLELGNHALSHTRDALSKQAVHHALEDVQLVLNGEVNEVGIDQDVIGRPQLHVVLKVKTHSLLLHLLNFDFVQSRGLILLLLLLLLLVIVLSFNVGGLIGVVLGLLDLFGVVALLQTLVIRVEHPLDLSKLPRLICFSLSSNMRTKIKKGYEIRTL